MDTGAVKFHKKKESLKSIIIIILYYYCVFKGVICDFNISFLFGVLQVDCA